MAVGFAHEWNDCPELLFATTIGGPRQPADALRLRSALRTYGTIVQSPLSLAMAVAGSRRLDYCFARLVGGL